MKRFFFVALAALALLVPALSYAQVKTIYVAGPHPTVIVVHLEQGVPNVERAPLASMQVIARHEAMAAARRSAPRVNHSAVSHCERLIADARAELRKNF